MKRTFPEHNLSSNPGGTFDFYPGGVPGVKIKIGSIMIDNSLKNKLMKMKNSMKEV